MPHAGCREVKNGARYSAAGIEIRGSTNLVDVEVRNHGEICGRAMPVSMSARRVYRRFPFDR